MGQHDHGSFPLPAPWIGLSGLVWGFGNIAGEVAKVGQISAISALGPILIGLAGVAGIGWKAYVRWDNKRLARALIENRALKADNQTLTARLRAAESRGDANSSPSSGSISG